VGGCKHGHAYLTSRAGSHIQLICFVVSSFLTSTCSLLRSLSACQTHVDLAIWSDLSESHIVTLQLLHAGNLAVADTYSHTRHELAEDQVNDMNVARIMALNGVTPIEADDAWAFANGWLEDTFANPQTHEAVRDLVRTSIESTRKTSPPVGGGLPEVVPVIWDAALKRWRPDPTVIAAGNANRQIHVVQNGAVVPTLISAGNAASETTTNTIPTPGDAEMSAPVETSAVSEDTTMSSQDPPPPHGDPASSEPAAGAESTMDTHE
jgi:hypothetical protein